MARLVGVDLPREKRVVVARTYIFGGGRTRAERAVTATEIDRNTRVKDLSEPQLIALRDYIEANYPIEGGLRREVGSDIRRKVESGWYQGVRHRRGLPARG